MTNIIIFRYTSSTWQVGSILWFYGGQSNMGYASTYYDDVWTYDTTTNIWREIPQISGTYFLA